MSNISKIDFMKIVDCLDILAKACEERGVKFGKYDEKDLLQILHWYRNYKLGDPPPF